MHGLIIVVSGVAWVLWSHSWSTRSDLPRWTYFTTIYPYMIALIVWLVFSGLWIMGH